VSTVRPTLSATLVELLEVFVPPDPSLRVTRLELDLPLEVAFELDGAGRPVLLAGPPRWRWVTVFDSRPGRLQVALRGGTP
jgi:hypothetical protein